LLATFGAGYSGDPKEPDPPLTGEDLMRRATRVSEDAEPSGLNPITPRPVPPSPILWASLVTADPNMVPERRSALPRQGRWR
jgi:hypothetical protein